MIRQHIPTIFGQSIEPVVQTKSDVQRLCIHVKSFLNTVRDRWDALVTSPTRIEIALKLLEHIKEKIDRHKILIFNERKRMAEKLFAELKLIGLQQIAGIVHSGANRQVIQRNITKFQEHKYSILVSVKQLNEGVDIPQADIGIMVSSTNSERQLIQTIGRMLRKKDGEISKFAKTYSPKNRRRTNNDGTKIWI